jgi:hypothetical protein
MDAQVTPPPLPTAALRARKWRTPGAMRTIVTAAVIVAVSCSAASAQSAGEMLTNCAPVETAQSTATNGRRLPVSIQVGECVGYFNAMLDTRHALADGTDPAKKITALHFCPPQGVSTWQMIAVFSAYTRAHPEQHHLDTFWVSMGAFTQAFPCNR